jgi:ketosteroid isomerase-like protein
VATRASTPTRSKEHHVAVGLNFWSAFKQGDIGACVDLLHDRVEWYPSPALADTDRVRGADDVGMVLQALYDRFADGIDVLPEDGRQVGDHVLMVTVISGQNQFTKQPIKSRECWVVWIHDDKWARIVAYPNAPSARLGFEELLGAGSAEIIPAPEAPDRVSIPPAMENSTPTPAEFANSDVPSENGPALSSTPPGASSNHITLTFTFEEAEALNRWMLKPSQEGGLAADDSAVRPGVMKIRTAVEHAQAISAVRHELEQAGVPTQHLSDQQVAQLGRRISQAAPRLGGQPSA